MPEESIVKPKPLRDFGRKRVLCIPFEPSSKIISRHLQKKAVEEKDMDHGRLFLLEDKAVLYRTMGAPLTVFFLESLIASGAEEIIILGFCGSLNPSYRIGDVVSINMAFSDEGTSRHYLPGKSAFHPGPSLKKTIEDILQNKGLSFSEGVVVSTDAPFRETESWLEKNQEAGTGLVDMEASAVFALAEFHEIESAALMIVSDELFSGTWVEGFRNPLLQKRVKDYFLPFL